MDFRLLISLLSEMDIHQKYWDIYEEMGVERWADELEDLHYNHFVGASGFGISQTIQQAFDTDVSNNSVSWTISLELESGKAKIRCYSKYYYNDWPYCISLPNFYEQSVTEVSELPAVLKEAADALISNLFTIRREKKCRVLWQTAQDEDNGRLQEYHARVGFVPPEPLDPQTLRPNSQGEPNA